jgi:predicted metalloprotease with PDZ domain
MAQQPARAAPGASTIPMQVAELKAQDLRLAATINRLAVANRRLCGNVMPATGLVLHGRDQYSAEVRAAAGASLQFETAVAVAGIVPDSPADDAGLRENDSIVTISGIPVQPIAAQTGRTSAPRDQAEKLLASLPPTQLIDIAYLRAGTRRAARLMPVAKLHDVSVSLARHRVSGEDFRSHPAGGDRH